MDNPLDSLVALVSQAVELEKFGFITPAIAMVYIGIDTMSFLSLPTTEEAQTRRHFTEWVDTYMKGHPDQPYQYRGKDLYAARCALLHAFSAETQLHEKDKDIRIIGYHDGGKHSYDPKIDERLTLLGTKSFVNDFIHAACNFIKAAQKSSDLQERMNAKITKVLKTIPLKHSEAVRVYEENQPRSEA